jgi:hypothetical protein
MGRELETGVAPIWTDRCEAICRRVGLHRLAALISKEQSRMALTRALQINMKHMKHIPRVR